MLRRCFLELSSTGRSVGKYNRINRTQTPFSLSSRRGFSSGPKPPQGTPAGQRPREGKPDLTQNSDAGQKSTSPGNLVPKILLGTIVVGVAVIAANQTGYIDIDLLHSKNQKLSLETGNLDNTQNLKHDGEVTVNKEPIELSPSLVDVIEKKNEFDYVEDKEIIEKDETVPSFKEEPTTSKEIEVLGVQGHSSPHDEHTSDTEVTVEDSINNGSMQIEDSSEQNATEVSSQNGVDVDLSPAEQIPVHQEITKNEEEPGNASKDSLEHETEAPSSLSEAYSLQVEEVPEFSPSEEQPSGSTSEKEALEVSSEGFEDKESKDEKIILDLIEAIHIAEKRQVELDFRVFEEEKRLLKEKYEKDLKDARVRELMFAEEAAMLEKELNKERTKAEATVKMLKDKAEQNLRTELQCKDEELEGHIKKVKELAKAELNAAVANEKASQIEKIAEANLHINALCMAFYARSEEARQSHSVHKLALGALALEDALSKGLPLGAEINVLRASLDDIKSDSLIALVLSSLPEETLNNGTDTKLQLHQKFDALKGTLRHFSLIPPSGGGILTHAMASIASSIKIREKNLSGDGIESTISRVESLLAEGKISEAADALEEGVSGTEAEGAVQNWVRQARNRAITEQALAVLQSYATSISLT